MTAKKKRGRPLGSHAVTMSEVIAANRNSGGHFFDACNMRFFNCQLGDVYTGPGGVFFITSEQQSDDHERRYTFRSIDMATGDILHDGSKFQEFSDEDDANGLAVKLAGVGSRMSSKSVSAPTDLEDFLLCCQKHLRPTLTMETVKRLVTLAARHHRMQEDACNRQVPENHDAACEKAITALATDMGAKSVHFQGDPRGCTVKLVAYDGYTDDYGKEGICVPQHLNKHGNFE